EGELDRPKPAAPPSVLVVEDDTNERELLAGLLGLDGWSVVSVPDGVAALDHLSAATPDLVLMDMEMPRCDGATAIRRLRQSPTARAVPVVVLSGTRPEDYGLTVGPGGVDGWYQKPIRPREVLPALRSRLRPSVN
ncbi:MAG: response regulator, partial [Gemmataceae bacterium]